SPWQAGLLGQTASTAWLAELTLSAPVPELICSIPLMLPVVPSAMNVAPRLTCTTLPCGADDETAKLPPNFVRAIGPLRVATPGALVRRSVSYDSASAPPSVVTSTCTSTPSCGGGHNTPIVAISSPDLLV